MSADVPSDVCEKLNSVSLSELSPLPDFINSRIQLWEKFKKRYENELLENQSKSIELNIKTKNKDGNPVEVKAESWKTLPIAIARQIAPKSWCDTLVISKVNGILWDLERPLETDCSLEFISFDHIEGKLISQLYGFFNF